MTRLPRTQTRHHFARPIAGWTALAALSALAWLALRHRDLLRFYYLLFQARRQAETFYRTCATLTRDVRPHPTVGTRLDVYRPEGARDCPVLIYVYGGSWNSGDKALYAPLAQRLLPEGLVVVVPDYSLHPRARFPQPVQEIAAAIAWTLDHSADFGGDPGRVILAAQSAGAQIAATALLDPRWLAAHGHSAADIRGFVGISGVYDVPAEIDFAWRHARYITSVMGGRANFAAASPINFVTPAAPPMLLIHGDADRTVPISLSEAFHQRLRAAGVPSEFICYRGGGHSGILFDALAENPSRLMQDIMRFVHALAARPPSQTPPAGPGHPAPATAA
jgi:acetyl esterase/lipase